MTNIKLQLPELTDLRPRLTVVGVGGAGSNAVNNMISSGLSGVTFVVANTDAQSLANSAAEHKLQLGAELTEGLGAGARPEVGQAAAEEAIEEIRAQVAGSHMVFIAAGMGGGTGTGAASVIANVAREAGALTVGVVTKPFQFEGSRRMRSAEAGIAALKPCVDTMIVIPNQNLFRIANEKTTFSEAFVLADQVLYAGIACIVDLIVKDGLINLDFADVRTVMAGMGTAMMGTGEANGDRRAVDAAEEAISNPLLDDISLRGAKGLLVSITGGNDLTLYEVDEAATRVRQEVDPDANIIVGATFDDNIGDRIRVSIVASGMERAGEFGADTGRFQTPALSSLSTSAHAAPERSVEAPQASTQPDPEASQEPIALPPIDIVDEPITQAHPIPPGSSTPDQPYAAPDLDNSHHNTPMPPATHSAPVEPQRHQSTHNYGGTLSEALSGLAPAPQSSPAAQHNQMVSWTSESGAVFEDAPPPVMTSPPMHSAPPPHNDVPVSPPAPNPSFAPQPPAEPPRSNRRHPDVDDFPPIGQREYRAKMEQYGDDDRAPPRAYAPPASEPPRKLGFFERLTGAKRRKPDKPKKSTGRPQAVHNTEHQPGGGSPPDRGPSRDHRANDQDTSAQDTELPVFFGNNGRR